MNVHNIENAFINIKNACIEKLNALYPAGIPAIAHARLNQELEYLEQLHPHWQNHFEIYRLLCIEAQKSMQYIEIMDVDASSIIVFLLGNSLANPLQPHYYCPQCGYFEEVETKLMGIDLPTKSCPKCKTDLRKDGNNFHPEFVWNIGTVRKIPNLIVWINEDFFPIAKKVLENAFPNNEVVPIGTLNRTADQKRIIMTQKGFFVLPNERQFEDYPQFHGYLEDGTPCMTDDWYDGQLFRVELKPHKAFDYLVKLQKRTGIYLQDITLEDLSSLTWVELRNTALLTDDEISLTYDIKPKSFSEFALATALSRNSYDFDYNKNSALRNQWHLYRSDAFKEFPCVTRDDFFETFQQLGIDHEMAYSLTVAIRKGKQPHKDASTEYGKQLYEIYSQLPTHLYEIAALYKYANPRSYVVQCTFLYAKLAFYLRKNSSAYSKIVFQDQ